MRVTVVVVAWDVKIRLVRCQMLIGFMHVSTFEAAVEVHAQIGHASYCTFLGAPVVLETLVILTSALPARTFHRRRVSKPATSWRRQARFRTKLRPEKCRGRKPSLQRVLTLMNVTIRLGRSK